MGPTDCSPIIWSSLSPFSPVSFSISLHSLETSPSSLSFSLWLSSLSFHLFLLSSSFLSSLFPLSFTLPHLKLSRLCENQCAPALHYHHSPSSLASSIKHPWALLPQPPFLSFLCGQATPPSNLDQDLVLNNGHYHCSLSSLASSSVFRLG